MIYYTAIWGLIFTALIAGALWCAWRISITDLRRRIIPDVFLFPLMIIGMVIVQFFPWICTPQMSVIGAAFGYAMGAIIGFLFRTRQQDRNAIPPIGMGDIKLLGAGGVWMGATGLAMALILACISGTIWARAKNQRYIPFAPFFIGGGILSLITMSFLL